MVGPEPWTSVDFLDFDFDRYSYYDSSYDSSDSYYDMILFYFFLLSFIQRKEEDSQWMSFPPPRQKRILGNKNSDGGKSGR